MDAVKAALIDGFQAAVLDAARCANPGTEQEHRAHDHAQEALEAARERLAAAIGAPVWSTEVASIPLDTPVPQ